MPVTTSSAPVSAPVGTKTVTVPSEVVSGCASTPPPNLTTEVESKLVPCIVTNVPTAPATGSNEVIVGPCTVKSADVAIIPISVDSTIAPVTAPSGTVTITADPSSATKSGATVISPPNVTSLVVSKFSPVIRTCVPIGPCFGVKSSIIGATSSKKPSLTISSPPLVYNANWEDSKSPSTTLKTASVALAETNSKGEKSSKKIASVISCKLVPIIVIVVPMPPLVGVKLVIEGEDVSTGIPVTKISSILYWVLPEVFCHLIRRF
nr:hypothetical protein [Pontibacter beigongshangensis]